MNCSFTAADYARRSPGLQPLNLSSIVTEVEAALDR
jgi:hypothetical protein